MKASNAIKAALDESLSSGEYAQLFLEDLIDLAINQGISPEVVLREIRVLEGMEELVLKNRDSEPFMIDWTTNNPKDMFKPILQSPSATKEATEFVKEPLKGLFHKHYYVHEYDFVEVNVKNQRRKYPGATPLAAMITRIAEERLTGEWIIFRKSHGINIYLCLAKHTDGDQAIYDRLIASGVDLG